MPDDKIPRLSDSPAFAGEEYAKLAVEFGRAYDVALKNLLPEDTPTKDARNRAWGLLKPAFADFLARRRA